MNARDVGAITVLTLLLTLIVTWWVGRRTLEAVDMVFLSLFCTLAVACGMFAYLSSVPQ